MQTDNRIVSQAKSASSCSKPRVLSSEEVLKIEYENLNQWARHGEEAAHRIFNFYVSLLTAVLGGLLLITQVITSSLRTILVVGSIVFGLLVLIGVTFLDALIGQYSRNIHYRIGIERIRVRFRQDPEIASVLSSFPVATLETDSETVFFTLFGDKLPKDRRRPDLRRVFVFLFPMSTQQIFVSMVTSLLAGAMTCSFIGGLVGSEQLGRLLVAGALVVAVSFLAQNIVVRVALQRPLDSLREVLSSNTGSPDIRQKSSQTQKGKKRG